MGADLVAERFFVQLIQSMKGLEWLEIAPWTHSLVGSRTAITLGCVRPALATLIIDIHFVEVTQLVKQLTSLGRVLKFR